MSIGLKARFGGLPVEKRKRILEALHCNLSKDKKGYKEATRAMTDEELAWMTDYFKGHISGGE